MLDRLIWTVSDTKTKLRKCRLKSVLNHTFQIPWERPHVQTDPFRCIRGIFHDMWDRDQRGKVREGAEVRGCVFLVVSLCCMCSEHEWSLLLRVTEVGQ